MRTSEDSKKIFETYGIKTTQQRLSLLEALKTAKGPVSAEQLFLNIREKEAAISLSTVYRILETFDLKGLVDKVVSTEDNKAVYELNRQEHGHHLICTRCKCRMKITGCPLSGYENALAESTHYQISGHRLEIYGLCPKCQTELALKTL
jgi:Fur family ferric uptake transcriptional regulator